MSRHFLLTLSTVTALSCLSSAAFAAAVVQIRGSSVNGKIAVSGNLVQKRDVERLLAGTRLDLAVTSFSLAIQPTEAFLTLTGVAAVSPMPGESESMGSASFDESDVAVTASSARQDSASPQTAATENIGSASSFAAVPEPSSIALVAMGAMAFLRRRRS